MIERGHVNSKTGTWRASAANSGGTYANTVILVTSFTVEDPDRQLMTQIFFWVINR